MTKTKSQKARRAQAVQRRRSANSAPPLPPRTQTQTTTTTTRTQNNRPKRRNNPRPQNKRTSYYLRSLLDPLNTPGAKCPDPTCMVQTGTAQLVTRTSVSAVPFDGTTSLFGTAIMLHPGNQGYFQRATSIDSQGNITYANGEHVQGWATFTSAYDQYRVVSAGIYVSYTGSTFSDKGTGIVWADYDGTSPTSTVEAIEETNSTVFPARESWKVCYRPRDNQDYEFIGTATISERQHIGIIWQGVDSEFSANIVIVYNLEGIPADNAPNIVTMTDANHDSAELSSASMAVSRIALMAAPVAATVASAMMMPRTTGFGTQRSRVRESYRNDRYWAGGMGF